MNNSKIKRLISAGIALFMAMNMVSGCSESKSGSDWEENVSNGNRTEREKPGGPSGKSERNAAEGENPAMGRYVEKEMAVPEGVGEDSLVSFFRGPDETLELYTARMGDKGDREDARRFLWKEEKWQEDEGWWERVKPEDRDVSIRQVFLGLDGKYYMSVMTSGEDYAFHLYQVGEDAGGRIDSSTELIPEVFAPKPGKRYGLIPPKVEVGTGGNILVHDMGEAVMYRPDGIRMFAMEKAWSGMAESSIGYLTAAEFVTRTDGGVTRYRIEDGKEIGTIPLAFESGGRNKGEDMFLFGDERGGIYLADENGLAHINAGGSLWELILDGGFSTLGMQSVYLREFLEGDDGDYYGAFSKNGGRGFLLFHYVYDPEMSAVPPVRLTVYGLEDNSTVRQAAALFQQAHPEVWIEVLNGEDAQGNVSEDTIRALNTELLGGKGADVLILDGLPVKSYQEKGILLDLREVFARLQKEDPMREQVRKNFTEEDGAVYQMPARIAVPMVIGEKPAVRALQSLDSMAAYEGEAPLLAAANYENLLREVASLQYGELFDGKEGLTEETLSRYLKTVKGIGEKNGAKTMFTEEEMEQLRVSNYVTSTGILGSETQYDQALSDCGVTELKGMESAMIPLAVRNKHPEAELDVVNELYFPRVMAGVNRASEQPELAKEFVYALFSQEVQQEEFFDGFPVNLAAQETICVRDKGNYSVGMGYGDYHIGAEWPNRQEREEISRLLEKVSVPVLMDETMMEMIVRGAEGYLEGKETLEQAVAAIRSRIALYQAEQK